MELSRSFTQMKIAELHGGDPFRSIAELSYVSSSEEERLHRCPFVFVPDDDEPPFFADSSGEIPVASTGIVMLSPPENLDEQQNGDNATAEVFHTPPEASTAGGSLEEQRLQQEPVASVEGVGNGGGIEAVDCDCTDYSVAVDLRRDTDRDLGFSQETELRERIEIYSDMISSAGVNGAHDEKEVTYCEPTEIRVSKRELTLNEVVWESPVKKSKISDGDLEFESPGSGLGTCGGNMLKALLKTTVKLKSQLNESKVLDKNLELEAPRSSLTAEAGNTFSMAVKTTSKLSRSEKLQDLDDNVATESLRNGLDSETKKSGEVLQESVDEAPVDVIDPLTCGLKSPQNHQSEKTIVERHGSNREIHGESSTKRKLEFSTEVLESGFQQSKEAAGNNENREEGISYSEIDSEADEVCNSREKNAARKSIDDIDKFRYVGRSGAQIRETEKGAKGKRALPASLLRKENATREGLECDGTRSRKELTYVDLLRMLAGESRHDPSLDNLSILDCAKMRGMTFP